MTSGGSADETYIDLLKASGLDPRKQKSVDLQQFEYFVQNYKSKEISQEFAPRNFMTDDPNKPLVGRKKSKLVVNIGPESPDLVPAPGVLTHSGQVSPQDGAASRHAPVQGTTSPRRDGALLENDNIVNSRRASQKLRELSPGTGRLEQSPNTKPRVYSANVWAQADARQQASPVDALPPRRDSIAAANAKASERANQTQASHDSPRFKFSGISRFDAMVSQGSSSAMTKKRLKLRLEEQQYQLPEAAPIGIVKHANTNTNQSTYVRRTQAVTLKSYDGLKVKNDSTLRTSLDRSI